jgi:thioredoxin-related protein
VKLFGATPRSFVDIDRLRREIMGLRIGAVFALFLGITATNIAWAEDKGLVWEDWDAELFTRAQAEQRLVILDLEAVWCHWCHVMEKTTYRDEKVVLLKSKYLAVRVDQDANPDLSSRYGDWGWPATIIFAPDGTELAKWRGYLPPERMAGLLEAFIADPTPGPSARFSPKDVEPAQSPLLTKAQREDLLRRSEEFYDPINGGWGNINKFIDTESMDLLLAAAEKGDAEAEKRAKQTFDAALNLIDRQWGGIYQYSDEVDWKSPHYEKIMWYQASGLRQYAHAYALWQDPKYRAAAEDLKRFLLTKLSSPEGGFYTSQDADIDETFPARASTRSLLKRGQSSGVSRASTRISMPGKTAGRSAGSQPFTAPPEIGTRSMPPSAPPNTSWPRAPLKEAVSVMALRIEPDLISATRSPWARLLSTFMPQPAAAAGLTSQSAPGPSSSPTSWTSPAASALR